MTTTDDAIAEAIQPLRDAVLAWWSEPALNDYAAFVRALSRLEEHLAYHCGHGECERPDEIRAEIDAMMVK